MGLGVVGGHADWGGKVEWGEVGKKKKRKLWVWWEDVGGVAMLARKTGLCRNSILHQFFFAFFPFFLPFLLILSIFMLLYSSL